MKVISAILVGLILSFASGRAIGFWPAYDNHKGAKAYQDKDYESALTHFDTAIKDSHDAAGYHYNEGNAQYRLNHFDAAEKEFLLSLNATQEEIRIKSLYNLGNVKFKQKDLQSALDYYEKALQIKPDYKEAELNRDFVKKQLENQKKQDQEKQNQNQNETKDQNQQQDQENKEDQKGQPDKPEKSSNDQQQPNDQSADGQKNDQEQNKQDTGDKQENKDQSGAQETDKKEDQDQPQNSDGKDETSLKERQLYRILESIGDDPGKALKEGVLKEGKTNRKKIERPW
ncbi:MAG: hypothetical protein ACD_73C00111G0002 [uncultured bacterium]|nr:MAG: hypothetical protein ACD_73C00111G0002 [uncultured bacterium]